MRESRMIQKSAIGIAGAIAVGVALCYVAIAADLSAEIKPVPVDAEQYADFMETEVLDVQDMADGAEDQRRFFNRITPPGVSLLQPMFPSVAPFTATNFDESFLDGLLGEDNNSVAIYPLSLTLDQDTRETLVYNSDGKLIATIPADKVSRVWPADADPVRVTLQLNLLPAEDVEPYLYAESRIAGSIASFSKSKPGRTGGGVMRSLGISEFGIAGIRRLSNGTMRVTVTNGTDVAELFSYAVLHTSTVVVTTWTNEEQVVITDTNVLWRPVSPSFNGIASDWACRTTNLVLTNGVAVWDDSGISTNDRVRFYAAAKRADADVDGLTDGTEVFLYRTDPGVADTDLDGHSDGREIALETDPLDGGDYFGIVINAALPIPPPPGSESGREWVELFNAGSSAKSLAGFRLQTALPAGWTNVFTFPAGTSLDSGDFLVVGNGTNGDFQANLQMPNSSFTPPGVFGIRLVKPTPAFYVADALFYGFTNEYGFSLDGFGEELPILRPWTNWVIRRTWIGYDSDHAGDWKNTEAASWLAHNQGEYLDIDGDGLSNAEEIAGGIYPDEGGSRIDEPDSDFDGLGDADEAANGTNPYHVDSDGDALPWDSSFPPPGNDADELSGGTDPLDPDSDDDGIPDGWELSGGLDPLSPDSDSDAMPDGDEDSDGDGIPNGVEVGNLSNPFDAEDVDPRPYLWDGGDPGGSLDEGDIGYGVTISYAVVAQSNCQSIIVTVTEGGFMEENFSVECEASLVLLNPSGEPPRTLIYSILPDGMTHFTFKVIDGKTTWPNETYPEYGADITVSHGPASLDLDAGVPEESEESVGFLLADKSAHPGAARRPVGINGPSGGYVSNVLLTYDASHLRVYDSGTGGAVIPSGTLFPVEESMPEMYAEGIACSGMRSADMEIQSDINPMEDRVVATVLKADVGSASPLADDTLHPDAARQPLLLKKTLPSDWNGLMRLSLSGAAAFWSPTGGVPIVLGSTVFTNAQLPQTIYLMGDGCGTGQASFSVVGLPDCATNSPLHIFGVNATLAGVAENEEEAPGGFIADRTIHTNASRAALTLEACGPYGSSGDLVLSWNPSVVQVYASPTGGTALAQYSVPFAEFNSTNLYVEGIAPGINTLSWSYSGQSDCVDVIKVTVVKVEIEKCDSAFLPKGGAEDNTTIIRAFVTPDTVGGGFKFSLYEISDEPGFCMNAPTNSPVTGEDSDSWKDFQFRPQTGFTISGSDSNIAETIYNDLHEAPVTIKSFDYGAFGKIKAEFTTQYGGLTCIARVVGSTNEFTRLPADTNSNSIADAWFGDVGPGNSNSPTDDNDNAPALGRTAGDGLSRYQEYRGFIIAGSHERTSPLQKDIFIYDEDNILLGQFSVVGLTTHLIGASEWSGVGASASDRVVDRHVQSHDLPFSQHGLHLRDYNLSGYHNWGLATGSNEGPPRESPEIQVDVSQIFADQTADNPTSSPDSRASEVVSTIIAHELSHGVYTTHHIPVGGGTTNCIMRYFFSEIDTHKQSANNDAVAWAAMVIPNDMCNATPDNCRNEVQVTDAP